MDEPRAPRQSRRQYYKGRLIVDTNRRETGRVADVIKRRGHYYLVVDFASGSRELLLVPDEAPAPNTPHYISETTRGVHYRWSESEEEFAVAEPTAGFQLEVDVGTPERASSERQVQAAARLGATLAHLTADLLTDQESRSEDAHVSWIEQRDPDQPARFRLILRGEVYVPEADARQRIGRLLSFFREVDAADGWTPFLRAAGSARPLRRRREPGEVLDPADDIHFARFSLLTTTGSETPATLTGRMLPPPIPHTRD